MCYDESLNKAIQESEMDLVIRFWENISKKDLVRYWNSMFLGHTTSIELLKRISDGLSGLDLLMDGPSINWKVLSEIKKEREEAGLRKLINIGSCTLHVVHGPLHPATESTSLNLKNIVKRTYKVLKDSPALCEDNISITESTLFHCTFALPGE